MEKNHQGQLFQGWDEDLVKERYENFIAHPEGGFDYQNETLAPSEFAQVVMYHARVVEKNLSLIGRSVTPELREALHWEKEDLKITQLRKNYTWGEIEVLLDDATYRYLADTYTDTSMDSPAASVSSE